MTEFTALICLSILPPFDTLTLHILQLPPFSAIPTVLTQALYCNIIYLMASEEKLTKKELKELRKLEKIRSENLGKKQGTMKWIAITIVSLLFFAFFIGLVINGKNKNKPQTADGKAVISDLGKIRMGTSNEKDLATDSARVNGAKVTIAEYGDIQCPACKAYHPVVRELLAAYPNDVKLIFKHFPLISIHPNAQAAAIAVEAAGEQGKFFELVDLLYDKQGEWADLPNPEDKFAEYAKSLKLDVEKFKKDFKSSEIEKRVDEQRNEGIKNGISATPSFFVNGEKIENPKDLEEFKKIVDEKLKASGKKSEPTSVPSVSPTEMNTLPLQ